MIDETWLRVRCHLRGEFKPLLFSGLLRGQNQPVDQVNAAALLKYGQKYTVIPYVRFWSDFD